MLSDPTQSRMKEDTYLHNPHQQSNTTIPEIKLGCRTSVHPASSSVRVCEIVELGRRKCAQTLESGAGVLHDEVFDGARDVGAANARESRPRTVGRNISTA
jgi:hypothetical protein